MDNQRLFLYGALGLLLLLLWQTWQVDYGQQPTPTEPAAESAPATNAAPEDTPNAPVEADAPGAPDAAQAGGTATPGESAIGDRGERVEVVTDLFRIGIDTRGGGVQTAYLRQHKAESGGERPVELLTDEHGDLFVAQSGLQAGDAPAPTHHATWRAERTDYQMADDQDRLVVPRPRSGGGGRVPNTNTFHRNSYVVDVAFRVENTGSTPWVGRQYRQFQRQAISDDDQSMLLPSFFGAAYYNEAEKYEQLSFEDIADNPMQKTFAGGWAAMVEHYFLTAWLPQADEPNTYYTKALTGGDQPRYIIGLYSPGQRVAPGGSTVFETGLYLGPKERDNLVAAAPGLALTIDYGYLAFLSEPLFWLLDHIHSLVGNWGVAIILLTLLIKLVFYKLSEKSYRSMAKMRKLAPRIQQLKERYGDDREKMGRAMMDLYKTEKINPLGGCLPILVQIPVFIALYWMLLGTTELRHADFILWINDLSARDPYYVLPLLMGASMWAQQKLNPAPVDPMQQKIFTALPVVFTVFFMFFPAGLVLYWLTNNVLSIAQQYYITHHVVGDAGTKGASGPPAKAGRAEADEADEAPGEGDQRAKAEKADHES